MKVVLSLQWILSKLSSYKIYKAGYYFTLLTEKRSFESFFHYSVLLFKQNIKRLVNRMVTVIYLKLKTSYLDATYTEADATSRCSSWLLRHQTGSHKAITWETIMK